MTRPRRPRAPDESGFGCRHCYGENAERAWAYYEDGLAVERELVGEPHFIVQLRRCAECGQQFVWVFTEAVDWEGGEDAQQRSVVPLTEDEAETLETESLASFGRDRRYLMTDWPTDAAGPTIEWSTGELRSGESRLR
ncbi:MAG TPA: hypothetical protein VKC65_01155 [Gaiellaceae bacterium]|nr:hypothetical protein [Gaiellaceae bacterium]